jgi:hypothetical protein
MSCNVGWHLGLCQPSSFYPCFVVHDILLDLLVHNITFIALTTLLNNMRNRVYGILISIT